MTLKEQIIDCLADDIEDETQIRQMLKGFGVIVSISEIRKEIYNLLNEGLINIEVSVSESWSNSAWYGMTEKGREWWSRIIS
jgi:hypothetical protein